MQFSITLSLNPKRKIPETSELSIASIRQVTIRLLNCYSVPQQDNSNNIPMDAFIIDNLPFSSVVDDGPKTCLNVRCPFKRVPKGSWLLDLL